jgi:hypothetical protein
MFSPDVHEFLSGPAVPYAKFPLIGDTVSGRVVDEPFMADQLDMNGEVRVYDDGNPMRMLVVPLVTDDGERVNLAVKGSVDPASKSMRAAVASALTEANARLQLGGRLIVVYIGDGDPPRPGFHAPKQYRAMYEPPKA